MYIYFLNVTVSIATFTLCWAEAAPTALIIDV